MQLKIFLTLCLAFFGLGSHKAHSAHIIFDVGGVLVATNKIASLRYGDPLALLRYASTNPMIFHNTTNTVRYNLLFPFLCRLMPYSLESSAVYDETNTRIPQIMVEWFSGRLTGSAIRVLASEALAINSSWFTSASHRAFLHALVTLIFTPELLAKTQTLLPASKDFVRTCKKWGHSVFILSNWDRESFPLLMEQDPEFFKLFDGIVVSGEAGLSKPDPAIYQYLLAKYNLDPADCFFIDDTMQNVLASRQCGIEAAHCTGCDITSIEPSLENWLMQRAENAITAVA